MPRLYKWILGVLVATLMTGCGVRYAYSQLDWLVPRYVRDYVTLDRVQRAELDARLAERLQWHCASELPAYSSFLRELDGSLLNGGVGGEELVVFVTKAESLWFNLVVALAPDVSDLLATLDADQIVELAQAFEKRNGKARSEYLEPDEAERQAQRVERMERRLRPWLGRMNAAQSEELGRWSASLLPTTEAWLENRMVWQSRLLALLQEERDPGVFRKSVTELLVAPDAGWPEDYRAAVESNRDATLALFVRLYELADEPQRERLSRRLTSFAGQFDRLACASTDSSRG